MKGVRDGWSFIGPLTPKGEMRVSLEAWAQKREGLVGSLDLKERQSSISFSNAAEEFDEAEKNNSKIAEIPLRQATNRVRQGFINDRSLALLDDLTAGT